MTTCSFTLLEKTSNNHEIFTDLRSRQQQDKTSVTLTDCQTVELLNTDDMTSYDGISDINKQMESDESGKANTEPR